MFYILHLHQFPIIEQLKIEESLLRNDTRNFCIINEGSALSIVMGISGKKEELVDLSKAHANHVPIIKRFSGGGTVIVDENTLFVTFISQKTLHTFPAYPEPIMRWSEEIYKDVFSHESFSLRENDFVLGEKKFGGNAQYIKKERWLHHTSFLWDYAPEKMDYLLHPKKTPPYRAGRSHHDFLCRLKDHFTDKDAVIAKIKESLGKRFETQSITLEELTGSISLDGHRSTIEISAIS